MNRPAPAKTPINLREIFADLGEIIGIERTRDKARKPALIRDIVAQSMKTLVPLEDGDTAEEYAARLSAVLGAAKAGSLDVLRNESITVCLDPRLSSLRMDMMSDKIRAVLYRSRNSSPILALWDKGAPDKNDPPESPAKWSGKAINYLAWGLKRQSYALRESLSCARVCFNWSALRPMLQWAPGSSRELARELRLNPDLRTAPAHNGQP